MLRSVIVAAIVYGYGHPHFDGYRPTLFDRPLQSFYGEVSQVLRDSHRKVDNLVSIHEVKSYVGRVEAQMSFGQ